jgi:hypothetical protein
VITPRITTLFGGTYVTSHHSDWSIAMLDVAMIAIGIAFVALSLGYAVACDRL